jgi:hypothetical protein
MAPTCYLETLEYDSRLMNRAWKDGESGARTLRDWMVDTDAHHDPQAFILTPENVVALAKSIVEAPSDYAAGRAVAAKAIDLLKQGLRDERVHIDEMEQPYLDMMEASLAMLPDDEDAFAGEMMAELDQSKFIAADYDLA